MATLLDVVECLFFATIAFLWGYAQHLKRKRFFDSFYDPDQKSDNEISTSKNDQ